MEGIGLRWLMGLISFIHRFGLIELFLVFFVFVNVFAFLLYKMDRGRGVENGGRVSEGVLMFFTLGCGGIGALMGIYLLGHRKWELRLRVFGVIGFVIAMIPVIHIVHSFTLDRVIRYVEHDFYSEGWPSELDGYRIGFMTDFHKISDEDMADVVRELNGRDLDLLLLGGDFSMIDSHYRGTLREISKAVTGDGIFGVEGNHDEYVRLFGAMEEYGIVPLCNSGMEVREGFFLAGVQDLWNRNPNIEEAVAGAGEDDFVLLLSHNPDISMRQGTVGVDFILSGHTHDGQITFFGFPIYLLHDHITDYGTRFAYGFAYSADGTPVFVSSGVGVYYNWPRIFARPEVVIFTMYGYGLGE